jgi:hypothetical protein
LIKEPPVDFNLGGDQATSVGISTVGIRDQSSTSSRPGQP